MCAEAEDERHRWIGYVIRLTRRAAVTWVERIGKLQDGAVMCTGLFWKFGGVEARPEVNAIWN